MPKRGQRLPYKLRYQYSHMNKPAIIPFGDVDEAEIQLKMMLDRGAEVELFHKEGDSPHLRQVAVYLIDEPHAVSPDPVEGEGCWRCTCGRKGAAKGWEGYPGQDHAELFALGS